MLIHEADVSEAGASYKFEAIRGPIDSILSSTITDGDEAGQESPIKIYILGVQLPNGAIIRIIPHSDLMHFYSEFVPKYIEDQGVLEKLDVTCYERVNGELDQPLSEYCQFEAMLGTEYEPGHEWDFSSENERFEFETQTVGDTW
ncbi:MAG: hypothetical protein MMC33_006247 [Icmadophila ericetorum]|nr:hypothetical protein [Icmadophila ericetorum]